MLLRSLGSVAFSLVVFACSSSGATTPTTPPSNDGGSTADTSVVTSSDAASPSSSDSATPPSGDASIDSTSQGTTAVTGTVGGKPFAAASGFFFVSDQGNIDLVLSDKADLCASVQQGKIHPGETLVQLYQLQGSAPGAFTSLIDDIKYATIATTCASNAPVGDAEVAAASGVSTATIDVSQSTPTKLEGTLSITFDDGSSVSGSFSVAACASTVRESSTCY